MGYDQIAKLLNAIADNFGWERVMDGHNIVGLKQVKHIQIRITYDQDQKSYVNLMS